MEEHRIGISFSFKRARVLIYHDTIKALLEPECFRFLINEDVGKLAMQVCNFGEDGFHIVPDFKDKDPKFSYEICSIELLRMIYAMCGWKEEETYRAFGKLYPAEKIVEFLLKDAEAITDADFVDPETIQH